MAAEVTKHGMSGYRRGCHCEICREAKRTYMASWRAKQREVKLAAALADSEPLVVERPVPEPVVATSSLDLKAKAGPLERALLKDLSKPDAKVPFRRHLVRLARLNARVLDQIAEIDRLDLISPVQLRQFEVLQRLAMLGFAGLSDDAGDGSEQPSLADQAARMLQEMAEGSGGSGTDAQPA
ncbi:hypothetical protein [Cellulomonas sp. HZM]|uniref:hypothetical protein n=1 Tax=Cellulomonas sp. HZM TaxID=1454010 RepID=UPI000492FBC0|nr:hypothetical protein [Cellulomonas sp. HZM]